MPIDFACPGCAKRYQVADHLAGRRVRCKACDATLEVPAADALDLGIVTDEPVVPPLPVPLPDVLSSPVPPPGIDRFEYKMVQIPPNISIEEGVPFGQRAANFLEAVVNKYARQGWEFYRIDPIGIHVNPGCFGALLGKTSTTTEFFVISFRRPVST